MENALRVRALAAALVHLHRRELREDARLPA